MEKKTVLAIRALVIVIAFLILLISKGYVHQDLAIVIEMSGS